MSHEDNLLIINLLCYQSSKPFTEKKLFSKEPLMLKSPFLVLKNCENVLITGFPHFLHLHLHLEAENTKRFASAEDPLRAPRSSYNLLIITQQHKNRKIPLMSLNL